MVGHSPEVSGTEKKYLQYFKVERYLALESVLETQTFSKRAHRGVLGLQSFILSINLP